MKKLLSAVSILICLTGQDVYSQEAFKILTEKDLGSSKKEINILVSETITKSDLRQLLESIGLEKREEVLGVYAFTKEKDFKDSQSHWAGMLHRANGKSDVIINDLRFVRYDGLAEDKFGLSDEKRKGIFTEYLTEYERAFTDAESTYPLNGSAIRGMSKEQILEQGHNQTQLRERLKDEYQNGLANKHSISREILSEIVSEGHQKGWFNG